MRLSKIKLAGFKSFVDPTSISFPGNLIGVVGPNGCGKSNVIDAVRWVMGESSAKHLRGESMADVIFNGSNARKPVGHATIELVFDNTEGKLGGQYANYNEIAIKRQVSRDGQSSYFLNGTRCRRRDITDVFLGTGLGPRSYAIIEQGMISRLIEARPEDLRVFLEEAAGISRYKERRRETENRIKHTRENLDRLNDLLEEIEKQLNHLQRQAKTAEKYKVLKEEERRARAELLALRYMGLHEDSASRERRINEHQTALEAVIAEQRAVEAAIEKARAELTEANDSFNEVQGRFYAVGSEIGRVEQSIQHSRETRQRQQEELTQADQAWSEVESHIRADSQRLEELVAELAGSEPALQAARTTAAAAADSLQQAEQAMQDWQTQWDEFNRRAAEPSQTAQVERTRIDHLERQASQHENRQARISEERARLSATDLETDIARLADTEQSAEQEAATRQAELDKVMARITELRDQVERQSAELDQGRNRQQSLRGRMASLEALQQAALGQQAGAVTSWLASQQLAQAPRLAQELHVEPGWERAVETVLGFYLEAVCVDGIDRVAGVLDGLEHGALALLDTRMLSAEAASGKTDLLLSRVRAPWALDSLLGGVYAVDSLQDALRMRAGLAVHESVITRDGIWLGRGWLRVARDADEKAGVLERKNEIKEIEENLNKEDEIVERLRQALDAARVELKDSEQQRNELQLQVNQAHRQHGEVRAQLTARRARLEQVQARGEALDREAEELKAQALKDEEEAKAARDRLHEALALMERFAKERESQEARRDELRRNLDSRRSESRGLRETAHELAIRFESMRTGRATIEHNLERMDSQQKHLAQRRQELKTALEQGESPIRNMETELAGLLQQRVGVETELSSARRRVEEIDASLREQDQTRIGREQRAQEMRSALEQERMAWQEIKVRSQTFQEQIAETGFTLALLQQEMPEDASVAVWQENVDKLALRIQRLGPINLAAIEEFEEQSERKTYLDAQHKDVTEALDTLENAIRKIDRETRTRFKETYDKVNTSFQAMFPRLFGGGHAYMELTGDDLLDTGVTVMARPPGKRNSTIHLLSGGEKALTAVALVFSIFQLNPSPFCMLDEVDAPLDDANVGRFCDMVKEMSEHVQFIFITHNKITMELAHQLTGVTMHEPGVSRLVAVDVDEAVQMAAM